MPFSKETRDTQPPSLIPLFLLPFPFQNVFLKTFIVTFALLILSHIIEPHFFLLFTKHKNNLQIIQAEYTNAVIHVVS